MTEATETQIAEGTILASYERYLHSSCAHQHRLCVVLVAGAIGDYAAYVGLGTYRDVKSTGDKLLFEEALGYFPSIERDHYRK